MTVPASKTAAEYAQDWADDIHNQTGEEPAAWEVEAYRAVIERAMAQEHARGRAEALELTKDLICRMAGVYTRKSWADVIAKIETALASQPAPSVAANQGECGDANLSVGDDGNVLWCQVCGSSAKRTRTNMYPTVTHRSPPERKP
jgi:hypothetical protein